MCSVFEKVGLQIVKQALKTSITSIQSDEVELMGVSDLLRLPEYNYSTFPYVIARSKQNLSLINVRKRTVYNLITDQNPNYDNEFSAITSLGRIDDGGSFILIFQSTKKDAVTDTIKIIELKN